MIPDWAGGIDDLQNAIVRSHGQTLNIPREGAAGKSIRIGIIDSACELPPEATTDYQVQQGTQYSFVESDESVTTPHCESVFDYASSFCPAATFFLYQAVTAEGSLGVTALADAITQAIRDDVDILNVSSGDPWPGPVEANPATRQVKRAIEEDVTVVAAAGNFEPDSNSDRPPVHCPAAYEPVIAVGGLEVICPVAVGEEPAEQGPGPYYCTPEDSDGSSDLRPIDTSYCSQNGCVGDESCFVRQTETEWEFNPTPTGGKPDVLAPMHRPVGSTDGPHLLKTGTSFATPILSGSLGCIYSELREKGERLPKPHEVRRAVVDGSSPIDDGSVPKYDAMGTRRILGVT